MMHTIVLYLIQIMFKFKGQVVRNSAACIAIDVNVIKGDCIVKYHNGTQYHYTDVSRRALFNLLNNETISLGFFINEHLLYVDSKCALYGSCEQQYPRYA